MSTGAIATVTLAWWHGREGHVPPNQWCVSYPVPHVSRGGSVYELMVAPAVVDDFGSLMIVGPLQ